MSVHAIILAAGFGTRLRPITEWIPKPLMPVGRRPLLGMIAGDLIEAGVSQIAVNTHHLPEAIADYVSAELVNLPITLYHEEEILGTGGPLINARDLLSDADCFVLFNGDILSDIDLKALIESHINGNQIVTMALIDGPENKLDVDMSEPGRVVIMDILDKLGRGEEEHQRMTYAGVSVYSPEIFDYLPAEPEFCSIITAILKLMEQQPQAVAGYIQEDLYWNDLGTVEKFLVTNRELNDGKVPLQNAPCDGPENGVKRLAEQGSAREFYRLTVRDESRVLMRSSEEDADFDRFIEFGHFFTDLNLQTPRIYGENRDNYCVLMEDLGDTTLNTWTKTASAGDIESMYQRVIEEMIRYQTTTSNGLKKYSDIDVRNFDYDYLRWETSYFKENYLQAVKGLNSNETDALDDELDVLAKAALAMPYMFLHRDFQSQNIMIAGDAIRFVDFQGGRFGPFAYDVMSLVNDPYVELDGEMRQRLLSFYIEEIGRQWLCVGKDSDQCLRTAGLQRIMQALGAYGFLSLKKGKVGYQAFIPRAETYLRELLAEDNRFPRLQKVMG